jgi:hypothetical protein
MAAPAKAPGLEPVTIVTNDTPVQTQDKERSLVNTPGFALAVGH